MRVADFDFSLPKELIAQHPVTPRDSARLLQIEPDGLADHHVTDLPDLLQPGDLLVFNDTRVLPARLDARRGEAKVEVTLHQPINERSWKAFARPAKKCRLGDRLAIGPDFEAEVTARGEHGEIALRFNVEGDALIAALKRFGRMPLPPYIKRTADDHDADDRDYQTRFARHDGAVAAPTASLHFTDRLMADLERRGVRHAFVTLHVGAGTFLPVRAEDTDDHQMHAERFDLREDTALAIERTQASGGRVIAVGTTVLRTLEASALEDGSLQPGRRETRLFVTPGYRFRVVDRLLTNFHLPCSTLFMLVSAFSGLERMQCAYSHAIEHGYRFFSYGDACLLTPGTEGGEAMSAFRFALSATNGKARRGRLETAHGVIDTPAFMPVGTAATVKAMTNDMIRATGAQIILGNTYHLMVRPGSERIAKLGGLHDFMNWPGPILTDSGGFQVMSLQGLRQIDDHAVTFASHLDGRRFELTPERSIEIQDQLDSTITMVLDQCVPAGEVEKEVVTAMERSLFWAARSRAAFRQREGYGLFGIVQGGTDPKLRERSASGLVEIGFDGYAIGGLAVGEPQEVMFETIDATEQHLPADRPRYLMGVGKPSDIVGAVARGVDMFDCVLPTRSGRTAQAWVREGFLNMRNARHAEDPAPLDATCSCAVCLSHSRAYLHHLIKAKEILGSMLLTWHNVHYYQTLMREMREAIEVGTFAAFEDKFYRDQSQGG